tara:strand:+ start:794 stop:1225 length:432 start_codon:yes stop_codon:yes gene_type:complete
MKSGKQIKFNVNPSFKTNYGTVDSRNFKSLYVNFSSWSEPINEVGNWVRVVGLLKRDIKISLNEVLDDGLFKTDKNIVDLDLRTSGIELLKRSYISCEITLFLRVKENIRSQTIKDSVHKTTRHIINQNFRNNKYFNFHPNKK